MKPEPLTDAELERLSRILERFGSKHSMNLEKLDGFIAALVCGPDIILPSEYLPEIWGDDIVLEDTFAAQPILQDFLSLILRHWNVIADTLQRPRSTMSARENFCSCKCLLSASYLSGA